MTVQFQGGLHMWIGGSEISAGTRPRLGLLAARLALPHHWDEHGNLLSTTARRSATRKELIQAVWPEDEQDTHRARLRQLLSDLRRLLEPAVPADGQLLVTDGEHVSIGIAFTTDLDAIPVALHEARRLSNPVARTQCLLVSLRLFQGRLLDGYEAPWIDRERTALARVYAQALEEVANLLNEAEAPLLLDALAAMRAGWDYLRDPWLSAARCETCAMALLRLSVRAGLFQEAQSHFSQLEAVLERDGRKPSSEARELFRQAEEAARKSRPAQMRLPLIGRDADARHLERVLRTRPPLVTLTGPPGVGKTRLAEEVAMRLRPEWGGNVHAVALQDVTAAERIPEAILREMGEPTRDGDALQRTAAALAHAPCLLVLDNCEHLLTEEENGVGMIRNLLAGVPTLTCLATSREPLRLEAEVEFRLPPLPVPTDTDPLETICANPSVQLFAQKARAGNRDFQLGAGNATTVARLCALLDGLPLALTLAAGSTKVRPLVSTQTEIGMLLSQPFPLAWDGRHRTLRAAIQWSYGLLPPELVQFQQ